MLIDVSTKQPGCVILVFYLLAKPVKSVHIQFSEKNVVTSPGAGRVRVLELRMVMNMY